MLETGNVGQSANGNNVSRNMSETEYVTEFSMWAILASPLLVTTPIQQGLTDLQKRILLNTEVIAINQDITPSGQPVDSKEAHSVWLRDLSDGSKAVAFYNQYDESISLQLHFAKIGWKDTQSASVRDLWAHMDLGIVVEKFPQNEAIHLLPHETRLFRLTPVN